VSAHWKFTIQPGASERDTNLAREFWRFGFDDKGKVAFIYGSKSIADKYGVTEHQLRQIQQRVSKIQGPDTSCKQCNCGLEWLARSFSSRADFQSYVAEWKTSSCDDCRADQAAKEKAERERQWLEAARVRSARKKELQQRYGDRVVRDCFRCDGLLIVRKGRNGGMFLGCCNYPDCEFTMPIPKSAAIAPEELAEVRRAMANLPQCSKCSSPMRKIEGKYGAFLGCTNYPRCRETLASAPPTPSEPVQPRETFEEQERARMRRAIEESEKRLDK
jgi:ssDNA-binding Zn-finger/Zn-ribbon topoisomerase 1